MLSVASTCKGQGWFYEALSVILYVPNIYLNFSILQRFFLISFIYVLMHHAWDLFAVGREVIDFSLDSQLPCTETFSSISSRNLSFKSNK